MSDLRLYRVMRDLEGKHCGNEYLGNLVVCGECKHWHEKDGLTYCDRIDYGYGYKADDFCSYGSRSEKPNNSTTEDCSDIEEWYTFRDEQEYNARHGKE